MYQVPTALPTHIHIHLYSATAVYSANDPRYVSYDILDIPMMYEERFLGWYLISRQRYLGVWVPT